MMNATATKVWNELQAQFPNHFEFKRKTLHDVAAKLGYGTPQYKDLIADEFKVRKGLYNYASLRPDLTGKVTTKPAVLSLAKKIEKEVKKTKKTKSDRTWQGKKIIDADGDFVTIEPKTSGDNTGTVYVERDGVGYCYRNGEVVHTFNRSAK
jgi:hypothetical protein